jgi:hypothetical protein
VLLLTLVGSIASLNVSTTGLLGDTPVFPFVGFTLTTDGWVVFDTPDEPVVNVLLKDATGFPVRSITPAIETEYVVLTASTLVTCPLLSFT